MESEEFRKLKKYFKKKQQQQEQKNIDEDIKNLKKQYMIKLQLEINIFKKELRKLEQIFDALCQEE